MSRAKSVERYKMSESDAWDGEVALYSEFLDRYYGDAEQVIEEVDADSQHSIESLRIYLCDPIYLSELDSDFFLDQMGEDAELPTELLEAMDKFNEAIKNTPPQTYYPSKITWNGEYK